MSAADNASPSAGELMRRDFARVAAHDVDGVVALAHPEVVEDFLPFRTLHGRHELRTFLEQQFAAFPDLAFETEAIHEVDATTAIGQWRLRGTFSGADFEGIAATGRSVDLRGVDVMTFEDGLIRHNTIYADGLRLARQIGLLPAEDSAADRALTTVFNGATTVRRLLERRMTRR